MAKYTFRIQSKSSFLYSYALMNCVILGYFIFATVAVLHYEKSSFVYIPFFLLILYNIYLYRPTVKYWDMGGFQKMVLDTDARTILFDDRVKLKLDNVERVRVELEERPTMFWFLAFCRQYKELVNAEIIFKLETKTNMTINIQYKKQIEALIPLIRRMGIPCRVQNEDLLSEGVPTYVWYLMILIFGAGGFIILVVLFFQKAFSSYV